VEYVVFTLGGRIQSLSNGVMLQLFQKLTAPKFKGYVRDLSEKLEATFARLRGRGVLTEADIREGLREVRRVLLEADVNFQLTREFLERVEKKATGVNALTTVSPDSS